MFSLIGSRRFGPLFATQFLGAFNDNLFKTAFIFMVTFRLAAGDPVRAAWAATLAAGLFILPFFLFSGPAGALADARDKAAIARIVKIAEIAFMALGALGLWLESEPLCLAVLVLMGLHSTVFGPIKYAILPQHLAARDLVQGTGLVEGATFVAILLGQIAGGLLPATWAGPVAMAVAILGWLASRFIPPAPPETKGLPIDWNPWTSGRRALAEVFTSRELMVATVCVSWFWALGAVFTTQFVPLARNTLGGSEAVATLFLAAFSIGVAAGSALTHRLTRGAVSTRLCVWAGLAMAAAAADLVLSVPAVGSAPKDVAAFLALPAGWRVLADLTALAAAGGIFSVPLYAVLQTAPAPDSRARAIAANNIANAAFQVTAVLVIGAVIDASGNIATVLAGAALTVIALIPLLRLLPR